MLGACKILVPPVTARMEPKGKEHKGIAEEGIVRRVNPRESVEYQEKEDKKVGRKDDPRFIGRKRYGKE